ncbi:LysR family transcriptional regulator [Roseibium sp. SCP14]|uniref:LysR family transcriptional regulator n=1 Tax=Roseibium sp. SCP14 TaxID=3141375 RepID=UPI00333D270A
MRSITLLRLEVFRAVFETESITDAARRLGVSQPTVSRQLKDFQAATECEFFQYVGGRMQPTLAGRELYEESRLARDGITKVAAALEALKSGGQRSINIRSVSALCETILPSVVCQRLKKNPQESFDIEIASVSEQMSAIREGSAHIGFQLGDFRCNDLIKSLMGHGQVVLMTPKDHALAQKPEITWEDVSLLGSNTIAVPPACPIFQPILQAMPEFRSIGERRAMLRSVQLASGFAAEMGICYLQDSFTASRQCPADFKALPVFPEVSLPVYAIFDPLEINNAKIKSILKDVSHAIGKISRQ